MAQKSSNTTASIVDPHASSSKAVIALSGRTEVRMPVLASATAKFQNRKQSLPVQYTNIDAARTLKGHNVL